MSFTKKIASCFGIFLFSQSVAAADYSVTITNLTHALNFTPRIVIAHVPISLFSAGDNLNDPEGGLLNGQVNNALTEIAESGNTAPLATILDQNSSAASYVMGSGLIGSGETQTVNLQDIDEGLSNISLFSMMLPTNDGFIALNNMDLPESGSVRYEINGYDAGTETNTESCADIPGPTCGAPDELSLDDTGEGFVHIHRGIRGLGSEIDAATHDWKNPVAVVTITKTSN